jgi:hypothetical protein
MPVTIERGRGVVIEKMTIDRLFMLGPRGGLAGAGAIGWTAVRPLPPHLATSVTNAAAQDSRHPVRAAEGYVS